MSTINRKAKNNTTHKNNINALTIIIINRNMQPNTLTC